jgi:hypothetical protein
MDDELEDYPVPVGPNNDVFIISDEDVVFLRQCGISTEKMRLERDVFPFEDE